LIFVTGATGLIGAYLCRYLIHSGKKVSALKRPNSDLSLLGNAADSIEWYTGDLNDIDILVEACSSAEKVYHCAGLISYDPADRDKLIEVNHFGTANLVHACLATNISKLLHVGSIASFGRPSDDCVINESIKWEDSKHHSFYGWSKQLANREIWRGQIEGLDTVMVHPSVVLGAGYWDRSSGRMFSYVDKGSKYYSSGSTGFVDVHDLVKVMMALMESDIVNEAFIVNGHDLTFQSLFQHIAKALNTTAPSKSASNTAASILRIMDWFKSLVSRQPRYFTKETIRTAQSKVAYENSKLLAAIPFSFTSIEETIGEIGQQFQRSKAAGSSFGISEVR